MPASSLDTIFPRCSCFGLEYFWCVREKKYSDRNLSNYESVCVAIHYLYIPIHDRTIFTYISPRKGTWSAVVLCLDYRDNTAYEWCAISGMVSIYLSIFITKWCNILDWIGLFHRILPTHSLSLQIVFFYTTWISDRDLVPRTGSDRQSSNSRAKTPVSLLFQNSKSNCHSIPLDLAFFSDLPPPLLPSPPFSPPN